MGADTHAYFTEEAAASIGGRKAGISAGKLYPVLELLTRGKAEFARIVNDKGYVMTFYTGYCYLVPSDTKDKQWRAVISPRRKVDLGDE